MLARTIDRDWRLFLSFIRQNCPAYLVTKKRNFGIWAGLPYTIYTGKKFMATEDLAFWLSWCIEEYAAYKKKSASDVTQFFEKTGVLKYLSENAEILHTQGKGYILDSIDEFIRVRGL